MQTLSPEAEQTLIEGVKTAVHLVDNDGLTPDAAMQKVAESRKWGRDMVRLASQAYNTGRQTAQREVNTGILDKMATFELVDPDKVLNTMWPSEVKSAADLHNASAVSDEYKAPPAWLYEQGRAALHKTAEQPFKLVDKPPEPYQPEPSVKMARAYNRHRDCVRNTEEARTKAASSYQQLVDAVVRLRGYFKQASYDRVAFSQAEHFASAYFGDAGKTLMDDVYAKLKLKEVRASDFNAPRSAIDRTKAPFALIATCVKLARDVHEKRAEWNAAKEAEAKQAEDLRPFVGSPTAAIQPDRYLIAENPSTKQAGGFFGGLLGGGIAANTSALFDKALENKPDASKLSTSQAAKLDDPSHQAELDKIKAQAMLADLMQDDVLSGYDPEEVMNAYNEVAQVAPRSSTQPLVMRSLLRRHLQGNVEPFEAKEISDIEKGLIQTREPQLSIFGNE